MKNTGVGAIRPTRSFRLSGGILSLNVAGAVALLGGALFVALRAPGRAESEEAVGKQAVPSVTPADAA